MPQEETCIYKGKKFSFKCGYLDSPDGRRVFREYVDHPGSVVILPIIDDKIILLNQYRHVIEEWILELPAGTLNPGEDPRSCAYRELIEETGYKANKLIKMFEMYLSPGYSTEYMHVYLAEDLEYVGQKLDETEVINLTFVPIDEIPRMIREKLIRDAKTIATLFYYIEFLHE